MDKKNFIIGGMLLVGAFFLMHQQGQEAKQRVAQQERASETTRHIISDNLDTSDVPESNKSNFAPSNSLFTKVEEAPLPKVKEAKYQEEEKTFILENDFIKVTFTNYGGAIKNVALKKHAAQAGSPEPYTFNKEGGISALAISLLGPQNEIKEYAPPFKLVQHTNNIIQFSLKTPENVNIIRGYKLITNEDSNADPHVIMHETKFQNDSNHLFDLRKLYVNLGTFPATKGDTHGEYLNFGYYNGDKTKFIKARDFHGSNGFLGLFGKREAKDKIREKTSNIIWASVKNQFFTVVLTPDHTGTGFATNPVDLEPDLLADSKKKLEGINGSLEFNLGRIASGEQKIFGMQYYVGPKEYMRLSKLGQSQDLIMQFGFFGGISKILLVFMLGIHSIIPSWGLTIIIITILIKLLLWPLTAIQVRSSKRMAQIQKPLQEIRKKYKDNPKKAQAETMKLFKENKVNPAAGCLPLLMQLPIFLGFYFMLRTSSEMRFQKFLWISDLSLPDSITYIGTFPLNILPLIMGVTMFLQMRFTPTPTTDNAQQKIIQFMPLIFLVFCYNFPSALVLYWTVQNVLTIGQQLLSNRKKQEVEVIPPQQKKKSKKKMQMLNDQYYRDGCVL